MAVTIVETRAEIRAITGGVDTHADVHVAAALDPIGGLLGVREFPATTAGYARLLGWLGGFGPVCLVGIEGTGSYGAGLARHITAAGDRVVEVDRSDRQDRRRQGKPDPLDAVSAARAAQSGRARGASKGRDGAVEAIRALIVAKRSAAGERTQTINQARALVLTGPEDLRARFTGHTVAALVAELASLRPRPGSTVGYVQPHHPPCFQPAEVALGADHDLNPVQSPQPRAVLERTDEVVLLLQGIDIDFVEHGLWAGITGPCGVVEPDRVVDPADQVAGDHVAADQEDLRVPLAADVLEAYDLGAFVILGQRGR